MVESVRSRGSDCTNWEECFCQPQLSPLRRALPCNPDPPSYRTAGAGSSHGLFFSIYLCCDVYVHGSICLCMPPWVHTSVCVSTQSIYVFMQVSVQACICFACWCYLMPAPRSLPRFGDVGNGHSLLVLAVPRCT